MPIGWLDPNGDTALYRERISCFVGFTQLFNLTGKPAISLPLWWTSGASGDAPAGLPVGVQLMGRPYEEHLLLRLGRVIEAAVERRAPKVHVQVL